MARCIDADKLTDKLEELQFNAPVMTPVMKIYNVIELVEDQPTADAAEVKWIDVNERLPQKNVRVLVYLKENACDYTRVDTDRRIDDGQWVRWGNNVTHWMLLPKPPNGAKMDGGKEE